MTVIPKRVFIVPYRNRIQHKFFFSQQMNFILEGETDYEIYFSHQIDSRPFNRGAMKNIGFLAMKNKYPNDYLDMTFIFNDVDTLPFHKLFDYQTIHGIVKHYYGFTAALGGIVVFKGDDFEKVNGFPNLWGWGLEDSCIQDRCNKCNLIIDRSNFYSLGSPEILQLFDGIKRLVSKNDTKRMKNDDGTNGLNTIHKLTYTINNKSNNPEDNKYIINNDYISYINVTTFMTSIQCNSDTYHEYDLREPVSQIYNPDNSKKLLQIPPVATTTDWKHVPTYNKPQERKYVKKIPNSTSYKIEYMGLGGIRW